MIDQTFSREASIRELDETQNICSDAKGGSRDVDILLAGSREFVDAVTRQGQTTQIDRWDLGPV